MADKLKTAVGKAIYRARTFTVEPVLGIITEVGRAQDKGRVAAGTEGRFHASTRRCAWTHGFEPRPTVRPTGYAWLDPCRTLATSGLTGPMGRDRGRLWRQLW